MAGLAAYMGALLTAAAVLIGPGAALSLGYGSHLWFVGDHSGGKRWMIGSAFGVGVALACATIGTQLAALAHV